MNYQNFNRKNLDTLRSELQTVLTQFGKERNISFNLGTFRFTDNQVKITTECNISNGKSGLEIQNDGYAKDYNTYAKFWGVNEGINVGDTLKNGYKIVGLLKKKRKYPILAQKPDGKQVCLTIETTNHLKQQIS